MEKIEDLIKDWGYEEGSLASDWVKQGREQGMEQGIEQGIEQGMEKMTREGIIKMLQLGYEYQVIATVFSVGMDRVQQIAQDIE